MGYVVKKTGGKKRGWAVQFRSTVDKVRVAKQLLPEDYGLHQFNVNMTIEEARLRASQLNKLAETKRYSAKKLAVRERIRSEELTLALSFPDEAKFLRWVELEERVSLDTSAKHRSHWHCAKKIITSLGLKPEQYYESRRRVYFWFKDHKDKNKKAAPLSFDYCVKIIRFLNLYGRFYAREYKVYFEPIPPPKGRDKEDINDAHFKKHGRGKEATPLTPGLLETKRGEFSVEQYNWLYLSVWLGLRPIEVDNLRDETKTRWEEEGEVQILWVYQTKLRTVKRDRRWKPIPLVLPEQLKAKDIIISGEFKRPLTKTINKHLGPGKGFNTYSGRKGFEDYMTEHRGQDFIHVSQWLGHQSIDRTWKNYTNKKRVRYKKTG